MKNELAPSASPGGDALFLVWSPPSHGPRSSVLARELGIQELHFVHCTKKRGPLVAPFKYCYQVARTLQLLFQKRPRLVFVQSPPGLAVLVVFGYCALTRSHYIIDAHSDALFLWYWTHPRWLYSLLARKAVATIVTNNHFQRVVEEWGGYAFVLPDLPTSFARGERYPLGDGFNIAVANSFAKDEPLHELLEAATGLPDCQFYVTGRKDGTHRTLADQAPHNVHFTDFLPDESYYALLSASQAIMCLTTRDNTMQRGACEALWLGKPIITSDWPLLRSYFHKGTVHVMNTAASIRRGVLEMETHHGQYEREIVQLQALQRREWQKRSRTLSELMQGFVETSRHIEKDAEEGQRRTKRSAAELAWLAQSAEEAQESLPSMRGFEG